MLVMEDRCLRSDRIHAINFLVRDEEVWRIGANPNTVGSMSSSTVVVTTLRLVKINNQVQDL